MENVDAIFQSIIPGVKHYRSIHNLGDWVYDGRISYKVQKNVTIACIIKNCFNTEWATRPADLQEPRIYNLQADVKF